MRNIAVRLLCLMLVFSVATAKDGDVSLPVQVSGRHEPAAGRVELRVDAAGRLLLPGKVNGKAGWLPVSWRALRAYLKDSVARFDRTERRAGRHGRDADRLSRLDVVVAADAAAAWQHVQWALVAAAEAGLARIWIAVENRKAEGAALIAVNKTGYLRLRLPPAATKSDPTNEVLFRIGLRVQVQALHQEGEKKGRPSKIRFRFAGRESGDVAAIEKWVADAKKAATGQRGARLRASPHIDPMVPYRVAVQAIGALRAAGLGEFGFVGTAVPKDMTDAERLPYPKDNLQRGATWGRILAGAGLVAERIKIEAAADPERDAKRDAESGTGTKPGSGSGSG